jgi:hypothetical protein
MNVNIFDSDFWRGLPTTVREAALIAILISFGGLIVTVFLLYNHFPTQLTYVTSTITVLSACYFLYILHWDIHNWWYGIGMRCKCNKMIAYGNEYNAFRFKGKFGNLTENYSAYIECDCGRKTSINWDIAQAILREELEHYILKSELKISNLKNSDKIEDKLLIPEEEKFISKAKLLLERNYSNDYLNTSFENLRSYLSELSNKSWNYGSRESLYEIITSLTAYKQKQPKIKQKRLEIMIEDIDSFSKVKCNRPEDVSSLIMKGFLEIPEEDIKHALEDILCEPLRKKDWAGEYNDLYGSNLVVNGNRIKTAFMLKGPGTTEKVLHISECGKRGDQIVRLFESPATIFIVQAAGNISEQVIKDVQSKTRDLRGQGKIAYYCLINGQDMARILKAYGKI